MDKQQFEVKLQEFLQWTSPGERLASSWFYILELWAKHEYNVAYYKEHSTKKEG